MGDGRGVGDCAPAGFFGFLKKSLGMADAWALGAENFWGPGSAKILRAKCPALLPTTQYCATLIPHGRSLSGRLSVVSLESASNNICCGQ